MKSRQALLLGEPEINYLVLLAQQAAASGGVKQAKAAIEAALAKGAGKKNLAAMREIAGNLAAGLKSALFGRMVTSIRRPIPTPPFMSPTPSPCTRRRARATISL